MAEVWINRGELSRAEGMPEFAVVEYMNGLSSDIPNLPTFEEQQIIVEEQKIEEEKKEEVQEEKEEV